MSEDDVKKKKLKKAKIIAVFPLFKVYAAFYISVEKFYELQKKKAKKKKKSKINAVFPLFKVNTAFPFSV